MKTIIFDMDGVLIDSESSHQESEIKALAAFDLHITPKDLQPFAGATRDAFVTGITERFGVSLDWDGVFEQKDELFFKLMEEVKTVPGVETLLHRIKDAGLKLGLATSSQKRHLSFILNKFGWEPLFDVAVCAADITKSKPDPEIFLKAANGLGAQSAECVVIEDSLNGLRAAKAAGMYTIAITTTFPREALTDADWIIDRFDEIDVEALMRLSSDFH